MFGKRGGGMWAVLGARYSLVSLKIDLSQFSYTVIPAKAGIQRFADIVIVAHPLAFNNRERLMAARPLENGQYKYNAPYIPPLFLSFSKPLRLCAIAPSRQILRPR